MVRRLVVGGLAAVVAGVVLGAVARALMSVVALASGETPAFTWAGSAFVVGIYVVSILPGGVLAGLTTHRLRWLLLVGGAVFLAVPAIGVAGDDVQGAGDFTTAQWIGVGLAGAALFATILVLPVLTARLADTWLGRRHRSEVPVGAAAG